MSEIGWPVEHPSDKRPCSVCNMRPIVMRETQVPTVGGCVRCFCPYEVVNGEGQVVDTLFAALDIKTMAIAVMAWQKFQMQIEVRPFLNPQALKHSNPMAAKDEGVEMGDFILTDFEKYLDEQRKIESPRPSEDARVETFIVVGEERDARWLTGEIHSEGGEVWGELCIDPRVLPEGTVITIVKGGKAGN